MISLALETARAALRGETHNTGEFTLPSGEDFYRIRDERIGSGKAITLSPLNLEAATPRWWIDETTLEKGGITVRFTEPAPAACRYAYIITGVKRRKS